MLSFLKSIFWINKEVRYLLLTGLIIILIVPFLLQFPALHKSLDFSTTGQIGDTIGGITSPFLNLIGSTLVYLALKEQIEANKLLRDGKLIESLESKIKEFNEITFNSQTDLKTLSKQIQDLKKDTSISQIEKDSLFRKILAMVMYRQTSLRNILIYINSTKKSFQENELNLDFELLVIQFSSFCYMMLYEDLINLKDDINSYIPEGKILASFKDKTISFLDSTITVLDDTLSN